MTLERASRKGAGEPLSDHSLASYLATTQDIQRIVSKDVRPDGSLTPEGIRVLLKAAGIEIKALAELEGVSDQYFHQVINRDRRDQRIEDLIAGRLGIHADRLWGRGDAGAA